MSSKKLILWHYTLSLKIHPADIIILIFLKLAFLGGYLCFYEEKLRSWARILSLLHTVFEQAVLKGYVESNPVKGIGKQQESDSEIKFWMPDQVNKFLAVAMDFEYLDYYIYMLNTGKRPSEPLGLMFDNVRPEYSNICVKRQWDYHNFVLKQTKTKKSRNVPMNNAIRDVITTRRKFRIIGTYPYRDERKTTVDVKGDLVFHDGQGNPLNYYKICDEFGTICDRAGVENIGLYGMRHTYATNFIMAAQDRWLELKDIMGHRSFHTTLKYVHLVEQFLSKQSPVVNFEVPQRAANVISMG